MPARTWCSYMVDSEVSQKWRRAQETSSGWPSDSMPWLDRLEFFSGFLPEGLKHPEQAAMYIGGFRTHEVIDGGFPLHQ